VVPFISIKPASSGFVSKVTNVIVGTDDSSPQGQPASAGALNITSETAMSVSTVPSTIM
jgi:hypothetical protein